MTDERNLDGADAREVLAQGPVRGYAIQVDESGVPRLVHWSKTTNLGSQPNPLAGTIHAPQPIPKEALEWMFDIPPIQRRTARERFDELVGNLIRDMSQVKAAMGRCEVPTSVAEKIKQLAWTTGQPDLLERIERVEPQAVEVYAGLLMREAAQKQKEKDGHKSALDWHGHDNASITVRADRSTT